MNKGKGLGRGIDALFQDIAKLEDVDVKNEQVTEILLNELRPNPYQRGKHLMKPLYKNLQTRFYIPVYFNQLLFVNRQLKAMKLLQVSVGSGLLN